MLQEHANLQIYICKQGRGRGGELKCYRHTDRQTYRQTYRPSDEVGCRGAFAPKNQGGKMHKITKSQFHTDSEIICYPWKVTFFYWIVLHTIRTPSKIVINGKGWSLYKIIS